MVWMGEYRRYSSKVRLNESCWAESSSFSHPSYLPNPGDPQFTDPWDLSLGPLYEAPFPPGSRPIWLRGPSG